jgi:TfoX/Sxy family transcriptional regulator of competence genes
MSSKIEFVEFVCEQIVSVGFIRHKKMFGEYMVYCNDKPIFLICDDTVYVKVLPETTAVLGASNLQGNPYQGAKSHFILDVDNREQMIDVAKVLEKITPIPKPKAKKRKE